MAADTREDTSQPQPSSQQAAQLNCHPPTPDNNKTYERFGSTASAPENANALPGGALNTAGGRVREPTILDAIKTIKLQDLKELHKKPCARDALLAGISAGFCMGGLRAIMGVPILKACSWAVGTFCFGSFAMHEFCQRKRLLEMQGLKRAAEVIDRKRTEREKRLDQARAARRKAKEEEQAGSP